MDDGLKMVFWIGFVLFAAYFLSAIFMPDIVEALNLPPIRVNLDGYF
jgi:hypothetical protein